MTTGWSMIWLVENLVAKQQKFKNKYPEGSLIP